jgi:hypothetical protein
LREDRFTVSGQATDEDVFESNEFRSQNLVPEFDERGVFIGCCCVAHLDTPGPISTGLTENNKTVSMHQKAKIDALSHFGRSPRAAAPQELAPVCQFRTLALTASTFG